MMEMLTFRPIVPATFVDPARNQIGQDQRPKDPVEDVGDDPDIEMVKNWDIIFPPEDFFNGKQRFFWPSKNALRSYNYFPGSFQLLERAKKTGSWNGEMQVIDKILQPKSFSQEQFALKLRVKARDHIWCFGEKN